MDYNEFKKRYEALDIIGKSQVSEIYIILEELTAKYKAKLAAKDAIIEECEKALKRSDYRSCACGLENAQLLDRIAQMKENK